MSSDSSINYGMNVRLRHCDNGGLLASLDRTYQHAGTSAQQIVGGTAIKDGQSVWLVKPAHDHRHADRTGQEVLNGDVIRLEHVPTRKNLHTHSHPAPLTGPGQFEVTAYVHAGPGEGDVFDDWTVVVDGGGKWTLRRPIRLKHVSSGRLLHSHGLAHPNFTAGLYEVTSVVHGDMNDLFVCLAEDQPDHDIVSIATTSSSATDENWLKHSFARHPVAVLSYSCLLIAATWASFDKTLLAISERELAAVRADLARAEKQNSDFIKKVEQQTAALATMQTRVDTAVKRRLTQADIAQLAQQLMGEPQGAVFVSFHRGDPAGDGLSTDIHRALEKAGFKSSTGFYDEFTQDRGIWLELPDQNYRPELAQKLLTSFRSLGVELQLRVRASVKQGEQEIEIHITN